MTPSEEVRKLLDERGVEWWQMHDVEAGYCQDRDTEFVVDGKKYTAHEWGGGMTVYGLTPEQAIAATVGKGKAKAHPWGYERDTGFFDETRCECGELNDISARYCNQCGREIQIDMSVIEYAEDWYTPQRTCKVNADGTLTSLRDGKTYVDAATVGRRDTMELWSEWEQVLFANVSDEVAQDSLNECVHELLDKAATLGRSCESCPEMDNPDSYIVHLHRALEVADSGAGTCQNIAELNREGVAGYFFVCSECGLAVHASFDICETNYPRSKPDGSTDLRTFNSNGKYEFERCPRCGRKVTE